MIRFEANAPRRPKRARAARTAEFFDGASILAPSTFPGAGFNLVVAERCIFDISRPRPGGGFTTRRCVPLDACRRHPLAGGYLVAVGNDAEIDVSIRKRNVHLRSHSDDDDDAAATGDCLPRPRFQLRIIRLSPPSIWSLRINMHQDLLAIKRS
jgi:hypothetical protein